MDILSDYQWQDTTGHRFGAFVFACGGLLAGLEFWSIDGEDLSAHLPNIGDLQPIKPSQSA